MTKVRVALNARDGSIQGYVVIDAADSDWVNQWAWHLSKGYAQRYRKVKGKTHTIRLHRELLGLKPGNPLQGDHIDRDPLNCRRGNLRSVTHAQNSQNKSPKRGTSSSYRGVSWITHAQKWMAQMRTGGENFYLGLFY